MNPTPQLIGAWLDKLIIIGVGAYFAFVMPYVINRSVKSGKCSEADGKNRIKKLKFIGWLMFSLGIFQALLALARTN